MGELSGIGGKQVVSSVSGYVWILVTKPKL